MRFRTALFGTSISLGVLAAPAMAGAPESPPAGAAWQQWQDLISTHFAHDRVTFTRARHPLLGGGRDGCPRGPFQSPGLYASVRSGAKQVFGDIEIAIFATTAGGDVYKNLRDALARHSTPVDGQADITDSCAFVADAAIAVAQVPGYWVEITGHCADGALYPYEVADALAMLRERNGGIPLETFAMHKCGGGLPEFRSVAELTSNLAKKVSYWHKTFPEARDETRKRLLEQKRPPAAPQSR